MPGRPAACVLIALSLQLQNAQLALRAMQSQLRLWFAPERLYRTHDQVQLDPLPEESRLVMRERRTQLYCVPPP